MGYANLSVEAKGVLQEIARLAYGTGSRQGRSGGAGRMGLLNGPEGKVRVVKFNTHWTERWTGPSAGPEMWQSSNRLRSLLLQLASSAGLEAGEMNRIRALLKLPPGQDSVNKLLDRRTVAQVVTCIGGDEVWNDALDGHGDMSDYKSAEHASFADLTDQAFAQTTGVKNVKTVDETKNLNGIYAQFLGTMSQPADGQLPSQCKTALSHGFLGQDTVLKREGYLSSLTQRTVAAKMQRLVGELVKVTEGENALQADEVTEFASSRIRMLLNADKYVLATYGKDAYQDVRVLEKFGVSPESLDLQVFQMARKYGFSDDERKTIFQIAARQMAQTLREKESAEAQEKVNKMKAGLRAGMSVAVFTGMVACREGNETRRNEIIQKVGPLETHHVRKLLEHFDNLSRVGGFDGDVKDHWNALVKYLSSYKSVVDDESDAESLYSELTGSAFSVSREKEVERYRADADAVKQLEKEIDDFCKAHGEGYRNILKVPARSFEACFGHATPKSYCEPYARYRFELVKLIVDKDLKVLHVNDLSPQKVTFDDIAKMLDGKFDELTVVDRESIRKFTDEAGFDALKRMSFFEGGPNAEFGKSFDEALDDNVSGCPQGAWKVVKEMILGVLKRKLLAKGPILGPDSLQDAVDMLVRGQGGIDEMLRMFWNVPAADLAAIRDSGIDMIKIANNLPKDGNMTADGHLLAQLVKPQAGAAPASFAGKEEELTRKIGLFEKFIRSDAMPLEVRVTDPYKKKVIVIVASAYPGLVDFVNALSTETLTQQDRKNFVDFVQSRTAKVQDAISQLVRYMVGNEATLEMFEEQLDLFMAFNRRDDCIELLQVVGDDKRMDGLLKELKDKYDYFKPVQENAENLLAEMRKQGVLGFLNVRGMLGGSTPMDVFLEKGILQSPPADYADKTNARINGRRNAFRKYANIRSENNDGSRESRIRATAAELVMRLLSYVQVKLFSNADLIDAFYNAFCDDLSRQGGVFDQIDECILAMDAAADDQAKADVMIGFCRKMAKFTFEIRKEGNPSYGAFFEAATLETHEYNTFMKTVLKTLLAADSRISNAFDDLMRTDGFVDKVKEWFDPGEEFVRSAEKDAVNAVVALAVDVREEELNLWTDYGLDVNQGILDADAVARLTRCGLTPNAIEDQIAPVVTRLGLTQDEKRTAVQAISAILARNLRQLNNDEVEGRAALAKTKAYVRQVLAGLADGTSGPVVAALLLCKSEKAPDAITTTIQNIAGGGELSNVDRLLANLPDESAARLMSYFNQLSRIEQTPGDLKSKWADFAKFVLSDNAAEIKEARKDDYPKVREASVEAYSNEVKELKEWNAKIAGLCGDSEDLKKQLLVPERNSLADYFNEKKIGRFKALLGQFRFKVIEELRNPIKYGTPEKELTLTLENVCAIVTGHFDEAMLQVPDDARNVVRAVLNRVLQDVIGGDTTVRDLISGMLHVDSEKAEAYQKIIVQAVMRKNGVAKFLVDVESFVTEISNLTSAKNDMNRKFAPIAAVMAADDLKIIVDNGIDVVDVFDKVKKQPAVKIANKAATGHLLCELLIRTPERNADQLVAKITQFYAGLSKWFDQVQPKPDEQELFFLAIIASTKVDVKGLTGNAPLGEEVFNGALGELQTMKTKVSSMADLIAGKDADEKAKKKAFKTVFENLMDNVNGEAVLRAAEQGESGWTELFLEYAKRANRLKTGLQDHVKTLIDELKRLELLPQDENPDAFSLYGAELMDLLVKVRITDDKPIEKNLKKISDAVDARINLLKACADMKKKCVAGSDQFMAADVLLNILAQLAVKFQVNEANPTKAQTWLAAKLATVVQSLANALQDLDDPKKDNNAKAAVVVSVAKNLVKTSMSLWQSLGGLGGVLQLQNLDPDDYVVLRHQLILILLQTIPRLREEMTNCVTNGIVTDKMIRGAVAGLENDSTYHGMEAIYAQEVLQFLYDDLKRSSLPAS